MNRTVLMITTIEGAQNCAQTIGRQIDAQIDVADSSRSALQALRAADYGVVIVEESLVESDTDWADQVWEQIGLAVPLVVNFSICGASRLGREVKAALIRGESEQESARRAATLAIEGDLRTSVTGLLLESELALRDPATPAALEPKLRHMAELAGAISVRLRGEEHHKVRRV